MNDLRTCVSINAGSDYLASERGAVWEQIPKLKSGALEPFRRVRDFLVPSRCPSCETVVALDKGFCGTCWKKIRLVERPYCEIMGTPFATDMGTGAISTTAIANPPSFRRLRSAVIYDDMARLMISRFKFSDRVDLAPWIAKTMERAGRELFEGADHVVPLPLHWKRRFSRRFNQSALLARMICKSQGLQYSPHLLKRVKDTRQQVGLTADGRKRNVGGAFQVPQTEVIHVKGMNILLIDDVYTSGASVEAASKVLVRAGAKGIDVLTFAKVHSELI